MIEKKSYLEWIPAIKAEDVFADLIVLEYLKVVGNTLYWLERRGVERGRIVLVKNEHDNKKIDITPKEYYIRTRVHEYGGGAYAINDKFCYFVNFSDQRIYQQNLVDLNKIKPITPKKNADGSMGKYGTLELSPNGKTLVFIYEKEFNDKENENYLACLDVTQDIIQEPTILHEGYDFYGEPKISQNGEQIAWLSWNHPNMPWDTTILWLADFYRTKISSVEKIIDIPDNSICFPKFSPDNKLYFIRDEASKFENDYKNWWNFYCYDGEIRSITKELKEFGTPLWVGGESKYVFLNTEIIITSFRHQGKTYLGQINIKTGEVIPFKLPFTEYGSIALTEEKLVAFISSNPSTVNSIYTFNPISQELNLVKRSTKISIPKDSISIPKWISYKTKDGEVAYAQLYLRKNQNYTPIENEKPPLIVQVHGGPTACAVTSLSLNSQFWTSSGYVLLDVDYRGSTGYGRKYRDALKGNWGLIDTYDIRDGIQHLVKEGLVNEKMCAIRGGSAGGYAVQRALTMFPDLFQVGASYFGIGNLITLVKLIHKFESHFMDSLIGVTLENGPEVYKERSPINFLHKLKAPMILFQGSEDKIVSPEVSREMAKILTEKGIKNELVEYEGETHGFRIKENNIDALTKEAAFFREVFKK